jgi:1,4-dihydroxy-2-naphthoyl-CoA hydrolase
MHMQDTVKMIQEAHSNLLPGYLGMQVIKATTEEVVGILEIKENLCTIGQIAHGGAIMAFADTMGAICAFLNMPPNSKTTTIESKTSLIRPGKLGDTLTAKSKLLNKGLTLMLLYTEVVDSQKQLLAVVIQTQLVKLPPTKGA